MAMVDRRDLYKLVEPIFRAVLFLVAFYMIFESLEHYGGVPLVDLCLGVLLLSTLWYERCQRIKIKEVVINVKMEN